MPRRHAALPRARHAAATLLAVAAVLAIGACMGGGDPPAATSTATAAAPTPTAQPTRVLTWPQRATAKITTEDLNVRTGPGPQNPVLGRLQPGDEVPVSGRASATRWVALTGIGWVSFNLEWMELSMPYESLPAIAASAVGYEFIGPLHPPGTSSGLPVVDSVASAIVQGDRGAILRLRAAQPPGPPPAPGPSQTCAGAIVPASELEARLDRFLTSDARPGAALRLYAVVGAPAAPDREAVYVVVFAFEDGEARQVWLAPNGDGIRWFSLGCGPTRPGDMLQLSEGEQFFWLRPPLPPPLRPVP